MERYGTVPSFEECIQRGKEWGTWFLVNYGFYYDSVNAYLQNFSKVKITLFDDFKRNTVGIMKEIYEFLDVDPTHIPSDLNTFYHAGIVPKNMFVYNVSQIQFLNKIRTKVKFLLPDRLISKIRKGLLHRREKGGERGRNPFLGSQHQL